MDYFQEDTLVSESDLDFVNTKIDPQKASFLLTNHSSETLALDGVTCVVAMPMTPSLLYDEHKGYLRWPKGDEVFEVVKFYYYHNGPFLLPENGQLGVTFISKNPEPYVGWKSDQDEEFISYCFLVAKSSSGQEFGAATLLSPNDLVLFDAEQIISRAKYLPSEEQRRSQLLEELAAVTPD